MAIDFTSFVLLLGGGATNNVSMFWFGTAAFALGGPINHLVNGASGRALGSLGIRTLAGGLAVGAVLVDVLNHPCDGEPSCRHYPSAGLTVGGLALMTAMIIDDGFMAREIIRTPAPRPPPRVTMAPSVLVGPNLAFLSLGGRF